MDNPYTIDVLILSGAIALGAPMIFFFARVFPFPELPKESLVYRLVLAVIGISAALANYYLFVFLLFHWMFRSGLKSSPSVWGQLLFVLYSLAGALLFSYIVYLAFVSGELVHMSRRGTIVVSMYNDPNGFWPMIYITCFVISYALSVLLAVARYRKDMAEPTLKELVARK